MSVLTGAVLLDRAPLCWVAFVIDLCQRKAKERHARELMAEMAHRMKNLMTVVCAIAHQLGQTSGSLENSTARLQALSGIHDIRKVVVVSLCWERDKMNAFARGNAGAQLMVKDSNKRRSAMLRYTIALGMTLAISTMNWSAQGQSLTIPEPLKVEHHELFEALEAATRAGGATAEAAKKVMAVLKPHFEKEEKFALPQLGALEMLTTQGATISPEMKKDLIARTERFRSELPAMLQEHKKISAALVEMQKAAKAENKPAVAALAEKILGHAGMEEKILYPAALLIGEYARSR